MPVPGSTFIIFCVNNQQAKVIIRHRCMNNKLNFKDDEIFFTAFYTLFTQFCLALCLTNVACVLRILRWTTTRLQSIGGSGERACGNGTEMKNTTVLSFFSCLPVHVLLVPTSQDSRSPFVVFLLITSRHCSQVQQRERLIFPGWMLTLFSPPTEHIHVRLHMFPAT